VLRSPRGICLVGSPPRGGKSYLAASLAAAAATRTQRHVILFEESRRFHVQEAIGLVEMHELQSGEDAIQSVRDQIWKRKAEVIVMDSVRTAHHVEAALEAASSGALVVAVVEAYDLADAVMRFVSTVAENERVDCAYRLAQTILGVMVISPRSAGSVAPAEGKAEGESPFESHLLPRVPGLPEAIRKGDLSSLQRFIVSAETASEGDMGAGPDADTQAA